MKDGVFLGPRSGFAAAGGRGSGFWCSGGGAATFAPESLGAAADVRLCDGDLDSYFFSGKGSFCRFNGSVYLFCPLEKFD